MILYLDLERCTLLMAIYLSGLPLLLLLSPPKPPLPRDCIIVPRPPHHYPYSVSRFVFLPCYTTPAGIITTPGSSLSIPLYQYRPSRRNLSTVVATGPALRDRPPAATIPSRPRSLAQHPLLRPTKPPCSSPSPSPFPCPGIWPGGGSARSC